MTVHNPAGAIAILIFLGTNPLMAADELDALLFGMAVDSVRALLDSLKKSQKLPTEATASCFLICASMAIGDAADRRRPISKQPDRHSGAG